MTAKTRLELGAMSVLAAMTCGAPAVYGQLATGDSGARPVILTFSYTGELVQNAGGGARRGATFAGAAGGEVTLLLGRERRRFERGLYGAHPVRHAGSHLGARDTKQVSQHSYGEWLGEIGDHVHLPLRHHSVEQRDRVLLDPGFQCQEPLAGQRLRGESSQPPLLWWIGGQYRVREVVWLPGKGRMGRQD